MFDCIKSFFSPSHQNISSVQNDSLCKQFDPLVLEDVKKSATLYLVGFGVFASIYGIAHFQLIVAFIIMMLLAVWPFIALRFKSITLRDMSYRAVLLTLVFYISAYTGGIYSPFLLLAFFSTMTVIPHSVLILTEVGKIFGLIVAAFIIGFFLVAEYYGFTPASLINFVDQPAGIAVILITCILKVAMADKYHKKAIFSYHKHLNMQLEKHKKLVQNAKLNLLVFNAETYEMKNFSPSAKIFTTYYHYNIHSFKDQIIERIQLSRAEEESHTHQINLDINGETCYFEVVTEYYKQKKDSAESFKNYNDTLVEDEAFCLIYDVTNRVNYEKSIIDARDRAVELYKSKSSFLAQMSHELRTPLNAIIGFSEVMELELLGKMPPYYKEYSKNINQSGQYLLTIVNDILDMAWIESGKYEPYIEEMNIDATLDHIMAVTCHLAEKKEIQITLEKEALYEGRFYSDIQALKQILINIVSNSVKYCPVGSKVDIHLTLEAEKVTFQIQDNGHGFSENVLQHFGSPFNIDKDHLVDGQKSTGLGLSITKGLTEIIGGEVHAYNAEQGGAVVRITVPNQPEYKNRRAKKDAA